MTRTSYFLPYQEAWLRDESRLKIAEKSRRIGWTYVQAYEDTVDAARAGGMDVWFTSADLSAAREYIRYVEQWAKLLNKAARNLGEIVLEGEGETAVKAFVVEFANGKRVHALSSNPKGFRSKGGKVVIDEFAFHEQADELWRAAAPSVLWGYPIRVFSSHNGKGSRFYRMCQEAVQPGSKWSHHKVTILDAIRDGLVDRIKRLDRPANTEEVQGFLEECREIAGDSETFEQEFMCNPMDGTSAYIPFGLISENESAELPAPLVIRGEDVHGLALDTYRPSPVIRRRGGTLTLGVDIGRKRDLTVLWVLERVGDTLWSPLVVELHQVKFRYQYRWLQALLPLMAAAEIDETGIGAQLAEDAADEFGEDRVLKVTFSAEVKRDLAVGAKRSFEDMAFRLPATDVVRRDINKIRRTVSPSGNVLFAGERDADGHADRFWALALARRAAYRRVTGMIVTL
ncbi:phage terminase large subunit family protein [Deinococcus kurensis]|uniref:phage terminase large subunit family protein n=1 Tax=Deinococcus kurensis TaxID=2662757 RepID=UPI0012D3272C|nr:terminase family protein [Deinococcus kurensis]